MTPEDVLVNQSDFQSHVQIAEHVSYDAYMKPKVIDAQLFDILPVLGNVFYRDLVENAGDEPYATLLAGGEYEDNGYTKVFIGLKKAICLFAFSRWCMDANINASAFGLTTKTTGQSEPVEQKDAAARSNREREKAIAALQSCIDYIKAKGTGTFPKYFTGNTVNNTAPSRTSIRIRPASRLDNNI